MPIDASASTVTAAYVESPFRLTYRQVPLRVPGPGEVLLDVLACGICGYDMEIAACLAESPRPIGHEVVGVIRAVGDGVAGLSPGDQVVLESGSFCGECANCRNGRVDLCNRGANFWAEPAMGFADAMVAPARAVVPAPAVAPEAAVLAEPCGVAIDMIRVAEIGLTDRVLIVGAGPIGLMALALTRRLTTGMVVVANRSAGRLSTATALGADAVFSTCDLSLAEYSERAGGFDRILLTAPPSLLPDCITAASYGGYIIFIGSDFEGGGIVPLDTHALHFGKKQLRSSFASPALYLPQALHLLRTGAVPAGQLVSHRLPLSRLDEGLRLLREARDETCKVIIIPDGRFADTGGNS